jgi:mRNA-degrading endonuclease toxin of MazEF toxin-antitoxin module
MRKAVQRGKIVYLTVEGHKRVMPTDIYKFGKRPFLVVQRDAATSIESDRALVIGTTTEPRKRVIELSKVRLAGTDAFLPKGGGVVNEDSIADCGSIFTVYNSEIHNVFDGEYLTDVMQYVDQALRVSLNLDSDNAYQDQLPTIRKN